MNESPRPRSNQLKLINPNGLTFLFTIWYNWYCYYLRKILKFIHEKCDFYKIVIALSAITTLIAFFMSISVFLQAIYNHFNSNMLMRDDFHTRIHEESLNIKLIRGNVSEWIPEDAGILYTAYFDPRMEIVKLHSYSTLRGKKPEFSVFGTIRIFGILPKSWHGINLNCHLKYPNGKERVVESTGVHSIKWNNKYEYLGFYILCDVEYNHYGEYLLPQYVGLTDPYTSEIIGGYYLPIIYPKRINAHQYPELDISNLEFAICIGPKNGIMEMNPQHLNEFFQYYKLFGVNKIFIYGHNFEDMSYAHQAVRAWIKKDLVAVINWNLKGYTSKELYEKGNIVAWNDCLYRTSLYFGYKYVAILDFNEFIFVKRDKRQLSTLLTKLNRKYNHHPIYYFQLVDYYVRHNDHMNLLETDQYCLAKEVRPFDYIPNRYLVRGIETVSITDSEVESIDFSVGEPQVDVPEKTAVIKRYQTCHPRMDHCQCNFNWPRLQKDRLRRQKTTKSKINAIPKDHLKYKFKDYNVDYMKLKDVPGVDDDFS